MGGLSQLDYIYKPTLLNEHISLDLSQISNHHDGNDDNDNDDDGDTYFSTFNSSRLKWNQLSNINQVTGSPIPLTGHLSTTIISSEQSYVSYGGLQYNSTGNVVAPDYPFMKYNILNDTWYPLPVISNSIEFFRATILNIGNNVIWKHGGLPAIQSIDYIRSYSIFDYKNLNWTGPIVEKIPISDFPSLFTSGQTATLVGNIIYKIGGSSEVTGNNEYQNIDRTAYERYYSSLNNIYTFHTDHMKWSMLQATGVTPLRRNYHTSTYLPDKNSILIYGGVIITGNDTNVLDFSNYAIYNITANSFMEIKEPDDTPFPKERYGHYATVYNSKYLLLMFGGTRNSELADIINVINISNPMEPIYLTNLNNVIIYEEINLKANNQLSTTTLIIIIVISIAVLLSFIIVIIYYLRRKMKKKKENIQLEKEDPRKSINGIKEYYLIKPNSDVEKELNTQQRETLTSNHNMPMDCIKPSQTILCKAYENQYEEKLLYIDEKTEESTKDEKNSFTLNSNNIDLIPPSSSSSLSTQTQTQLSNMNLCKPSISD
ncbi:unnamed protein product [Cunninghamella blakesleeana]